MADETVIDIGFEVDDKSADKAKKQFSDMSSLVADLAIISTVAGKALGAVWDQVGKSIDVGVQNFQRSIDAMVKGFDSSEVNKLAEAMANIGQPGKEGAVVNRINELLRSVANPETGEKNLEMLMEKMGRFDISTKLQNALVDAMKDEDALGSLKILTEMISSLGTRGSDFASSVGLDPLAGLENSTQMTDFTNIMDSTSAVYNRNTVKLDSLNDSLASLEGSIDSLRSLTAEGLAPAMNILSMWMRQLAEYFREDRQHDRKGILGTEGGILNPNAATHLETLMKMDPEDLSKWQKFQLKLTGNMDWINQAVNDPSVDYREKLGSYAMSDISVGQSGTVPTPVSDYIENRLEQELGRPVNVDSINFYGEVSTDVAEKIVEEIKGMNRFK